MHRRASEAPTWIVEKRPELARKQGAYSVSNATGQILKRGHELRAGAARLRQEAASTSSTEPRFPTASTACIHSC